MDRGGTVPRRTLSERRELDFQAEHHSLYDQLVDPETYLLCGMKKGRPKKEVAQPQTCGNLRNELHESARGLYPNFSGEC